MLPVLRAQKLSPEINVELVAVQEVFEQHADGRASQQPPENEKTRCRTVHRVSHPVLTSNACPSLKEAPPKEPSQAGLL